MENQFMTVNQTTVNQTNEKESNKSGKSKKTKGKQKCAEKCFISPWLSAKKTPSEGRFIQVGNSFLLNVRKSKISYSAIFTYLCLCMESGGKSEVKISTRNAGKYGIPRQTFMDSIKELQAEGFLEVDIDKMPTPFSSSKYKLVAFWKDKIKQITED